MDRRADLRRRLSKLKSSAQSSKGVSRHVSAYQIDREGAGQVVLVGPANVGKSTLFNCMSNTRVETSSFAFTSNKSNVGMVNVPEPRLYRLEEFQPTEKIIPATVEIVDIPGLARGASQGEGVGNKFLSDIRNTDALIHVLRCFDDEQLPHIDGSVNPVRDIENINLEL